MINIFAIWFLSVFNTVTCVKGSSGNLWRLINSTNTSKTFEYSITQEQASKYYEQNDSRCIKDGWVTCVYIESATVVFNKNGSAVITEGETRSSFKFQTPSEMKWKRKQTKDKIVLSNDLFLSSPHLDQLEW